MYVLVMLLSGVHNLWGIILFLVDFLKHYFVVKNVEVLPMYFSNSFNGVGVQA